MTLLLGKELPESAGTAIGAFEKRGWAFKFKCETTGKVEALHASFSSDGTPKGAVKLNIAIQEVEGGKPKDKSALIEATLTSSEKGVHEIAIEAGQQQEVINGTEYFLTLLGEETTWKAKKGTTGANFKVGSVNHQKITEITSANWAAEETQGPIAIWATGTETGGEAKLKALAAKSTSALNTPALSVVGEAVLKAVATKSTSALNTPVLVAGTPVTLKAVAITETSGMIEEFLAGPAVLTAEAIKSLSTLRKGILTVTGGGGPRLPFAEIATVGKHSKIRTYT